MTENAVSRLPVCDVDGELVGILTVQDLLNELIPAGETELSTLMMAQRAPY